LNFIVNGCHPFSIVEETDFKNLLLGINKDLKIPSKFTIQREIMQNFKDNKLKLVQVFDKLKNKIALTTDIWMSSTNRPYLSITAHFINNNRKLSNILIEFCLIPHPHTGEQVKISLLNALKEYGIFHKIISITTDNASNNKKGIKLFNDMLEKDMNLKKIVHFPRFGHILNLSINDGIKNISQTLSNLRNLGSALKSSSKKQQAFQETAKAC
jgi:hypothetical protein